MLVFFELPAQLGLFTAVLFVHNTFGAIQDVAIDSLACNTLHEDERGLANGLMFAGAAIGQAIGGFWRPLHDGLYRLPVQLLLCGGLDPAHHLLRRADEGSPPCSASRALRVRLARRCGPALWRPASGRARDARVRRHVLPLPSWAPVAPLPAWALPAAHGRHGARLALRSNLSVEFGLDENETAQLELWSNIVSAIGMVLGGWLSDKLGRRGTLFVYFALMSLPTARLAWKLQQLGYVMPRPAGARQPEFALLLWIASLVYNVFNGLMYGTRAAIMMDVTNPKVAGTQFTAHMVIRVQPGHRRRCHLAGHHHRGLRLSRHPFWH